MSIYISFIFSIGVLIILFSVCSQFKVIVMLSKIFLSRLFIHYVKEHSRL